MKWSTQKTQETLADIKSGGQARERALAALYQDASIKNLVQNVIVRMGGQVCDARDMFQEGLIVLDRNVRAGKFRNEGSISSYLVSTCKMLWLNARRKNAKANSYETVPQTEAMTAPSIEEDYIGEEKKQSLNEHISSLDDRSRKVLKMWQLSYSMREIMVEVGLSSESHARKIKHDALKKLMSLMRQDQMWKEDFDQKEARLRVVWSNKSKSETSPEALHGS